MNLKEHIRRILKEELNESKFFRRRVDMELFEKEFYENLNYATSVFLERYNEGETTTFPKFKKRVLDYLIDNYHSELTNGGLGDYPYDEVYEYFSNHFHNKIKNRYDKVFGNNINESIRILREENKLPSFLRRRFSGEDIDELISNIKFAIPTYGDDKNIDDVIYDEVREFMMNKSEFGNGTLRNNLNNDEWLNQLYKFEEPLRDYVKSIILDNYIV
jgi:hypothetical protein